MSATLEPLYETRLHADPDEIDLRELLALLRRRRWIIIAVTACCAIGAFTLTSLLPRDYRATVVLSPATGTQGGERGEGLGGTGSALSGLAGLAGISPGSESKKYESVAVLQSQTLLENYIRDQRLLPVLYPKSNPRKPPTYWQATQYFSKRILAVLFDTKSGLVTLNITWKDPLQAQKWANDLVQLTNDYLRRRAIEQSDRNITYLSAEAEKATAVQARSWIYAMIGAEIKRGTLARGNEEYAFKVLDPALAPESPSSLPPWLWTVIATVFGFTFSIAACLARVGWEVGASAVAGHE
jgi:uncharacterized protein involved in exopolysaccharide biosynthesis